MIIMTGKIIKISNDSPAFATKLINAITYVNYNYINVSINITIWPMSLWYTSPHAMFGIVIIFTIQIHNEYYTKWMPLFVWDM